MVVPLFRPLAHLLHTDSRNEEAAKHSQISTFPHCSPLKQQQHRGHGQQRPVREAAVALYQLG